MKYYDKDIEIFDAFYMAIEEAEKDEAQLSEKKKNRFLFLLRNKCLEIGFDSSFMDERNYDEIKQFLLRKQKQHEKIMAQRDEEAKMVASQIDERLFTIIGNMTPDRIVKNKEDCYSLFIEKLASFDYEIIFYDASLSDPNIVNRDLSSCDFGYYELCSENSGYKLSFVYSDNMNNRNEEINFRQFTISFKSAEVIANRYPIEVEYWKYRLDPWKALAESYGNLIVLGINNIEINEKEEQLMPYAVSLSDLNSNGRKGDVSVLFDLAEENNIDLKPGRLITEQKQSVKLYRCLVEMLQDSQKQYSSNAEKKTDALWLENIRSQITEKMKENGFEGQYPSFHKSSYFKGPKKVYGSVLGTIIVFRQKMESYIYCKENFDNQLSIDFICCYCLPEKRDNSTVDSFDAAFNDVTSSFSAVKAVFTAVLTDDCPDLPSLDKFIDIAIKRANGEKLSKEENQNPYYVNHCSGSSPSLLMSLILGFVLVGMLFLLLIVIVAVMTLISPQLTFNDMFTELPWGKWYLGISLILSTFVHFFLKI